MECVQDDGLIIWYTVRGQKSISVVCESSLCGLASCINEAIVAYAAQLNKGIPDPANIAQLTLINSYQQQYALAISCGEYTDAQTALDNLKTLLGSDCTCGNTTADAPSWLNDSGGTIYTPSWVMNSFIPVWTNSERFDSADTNIVAEAEAISISNELVANIGDKIVMRIVGHNTVGAATPTFVNTTTSKTFFSLNFPINYQYDLELTITRVDGDLFSWYAVIKYVTGVGVITYDAAGSANVSDAFSPDEVNIFDLAPPANANYTSVTVNVVRATELPE
jgi:hypothetical protein